jgi:general secretion pathway protein N
VLAVDGQAGAADLDVTLTSVLMTSKLQLAILTSNTDATSYRVRLGETVQGSNWRLVQLEPRRAVIEGPSGQRVLDLRVFDGKGGEAPTPLAASTGSGAPRQNDAGSNAQPSSGVQPSAPPPTPDVAAQSPTQVSQDQQVEAIRRRIEARRAQMRAEAAANGANEKQ